MSHVLTRKGLSSCVVTCSLWLFAFGAATFAEGPAASGGYQATGFKIGEVTPRSAIVWTRTTLASRPNPAGRPGVEIRYRDGQRKNGRRAGVVESIAFAPGTSAADLPRGVPGALGQTRVLFRAGRDDRQTEEVAWQSTEWKSVSRDVDYTRQVTLEPLQPDTYYDIAVEARDPHNPASASRLTGGFRTAPRPSAHRRVRFTVATCQGNDDQDSPEGFQIYRTMRKLEPDFFVHTGDIVYYDHVAKTLPLARWLWQRNWGWPLHVEFHRWVPSYFEKDDHDAWVNDCWPTMPSTYMHEFTFAQGLNVFREQVPMGERTYRTFRWGADLQVWLVEGRDFRSANNLPDGPGKSIWGDAQMTWFRRTVAQSDATFRVLISPTPVVGPDRKNKNDNHANAGFATEGKALREFLAKQRNMVVVCGDRHWQYLSVDPNTGVREYSCGPASDSHAAGWKEADFYPDYHRFLKVRGGFLSATVDRVQETPTLTLRFHAVDGSVRYEDVRVASPN